jgi:hypothetical protein
MAIGILSITSTGEAMPDEKNFRYTLTSAAKPHVSDRIGEKPQSEIVYECLEPYGSTYTLEELVSAARKRNYEYTFKRPHSTTVRESLLYHLKRFAKAEMVRVIEHGDPVKGGVPE